MRRARLKALHKRLLEKEQRVWQSQDIYRTRAAAFFVVVVVVAVAVAVAVAAFVVVIVPVFQQQLFSLRP